MEKIVSLANPSTAAPRVGYLPARLRATRGQARAGGAGCRSLSWL